VHVVAFDTARFRYDGTLFVKVGLLLLLILYKTLHSVLRSRSPKSECMHTTCMTGASCRPS